jgi:hypothetical protein
MQTRSPLVAVAVALLAAACARTKPAKDSLMDDARGRATREFPACPAASISTKPRFDLTRDSVEVDVCGEHVIYTCPISRHKWTTPQGLQRTDVRDECFREPFSPAAKPEKG